MSGMSGFSTQEGGMKLVVKNDKGEDVSIRKVRDLVEFINIFSNTIQVHIVSVNSLTGFILRITLPHDATPFRSNIFNERGELMNADEYELPNTGRLVTQHILKCCIVQPSKEPKIAEFSGRNKGTCTSRQLANEYNAQSDIYDATMAYGGMPVCPDVYAVMEFNLTQFREIFFSDTLPPGHVRSLPTIGTNHFKDNRVFRYLLAQLEAPLPPSFERKVGIILMESLPPSYQPLMDLHASFPSANPAALSVSPIFTERKRLFDDMTYRSLAICVVIFYRIGYIPLDAHLGNWMYDTTQTVDQFKVQAIDFGRIIPRNLSPTIESIRNYVRGYIRLYTNPAEKALVISGLARLLGIDPSTVGTAEICGTKVGEIIVALNKLIRRNQNGSILWNPTGRRFAVVTRPATPGSPQQTMEIDSCMILIHRILFLIALVDGCFNSCMFRNHHFCQLRDIFSSLFGIKCNNLNSMIGDRVYIDFVSYLRAIPNDRERIRTIEAYRRIRDYIGEYLRISPERGLFPDPFYDSPSPDTPEDPAVAALREAAIPPPPVPPPPPPLPRRRSPSKSPRRSPSKSPRRSPSKSPRKSPSKSPRKSPSKSPSKKAQVSPLEGSPQAYQYERFLSGYNTSHPPPPLPPAVVPPPSPAGGGGGTEKLIKSMKQRKLKQSRKHIKTKLSKILKTKKNKNHNRYRRNKRYRL
jgi:hypothetical protein